MLREGTYSGQPTHDIKKNEQEYLQKKSANLCKPLGKHKAAKFAKIEGITTNAESAKTLETCTRIGLTGDALRSAITDVFTSTKGR